MASDLKWRVGFGWPTVSFVVAGMLSLFGAPGGLRVLGGLIVLAAGAYAVAQYRKWNSSPWRQVHFRGMLLYSGIAGRHAGLAEAEGRPFDKVAACRELALTMSGPNGQPNVDAMITALEQEKGRYLARLLRPRTANLFNGIDPPKVEELLKEVEALEFGPDLVMCNIVENTYGAEEAARYAYAICSGDAH